MTRRNFRFIFPLLLSVFFVRAVPQTVSGYTVTPGVGTVRGDTNAVIVLRSFDRDGCGMFFVVDPYQCSTSVRAAEEIAFEAASWNVIRARFASTPYVKALERAEADADPVQDAGFTRFQSSGDGIELTIDLCPSRKPLDRIVFNDLIEEIGPAERPLPVAVSITGRWMKEHRADCAWLASLDSAGTLSILWINHTYNHFTKKGLPLAENFILKKGTDINAEIVKTEIALIERGLMPSVFFRFPGLVSDKKVFDQVLSYGLIPVGSDAWLAKGEWPKRGSIVLIHANGNEPFGIKDFFALLKKEHSAALEKKWKLFDLRKSVVEDEER
jgi:hypothetical protein